MQDMPQGATTRPGQHEDAPLVTLHRDQQGAIGREPLGRHRQVDTLGRADVERVSHAGQALHLLGPDPAGVAHAVAGPLDRPPVALAPRGRPPAGRPRARAGLLRLKRVLLRPALSLGIDPIHLGILKALAIEIGSVIPPVGLNLFAVSGVTGLPVTQVIRGSFPFCCSDTVVLIIVLLFLTLALWPPTLLQTSYF